MSLDPRVTAIAELLYWTAPWEVNGYQPPDTLKDAEKLAHAIVRELEGVNRVMGLKR